MNIPPAPVSRRTVVSTILFPLSVLLFMGSSIVNDAFPISATSTEERVVERVSDPNVEVGRSLKNPDLQVFLQTVCLFLPVPFQQLSFGSKLALCWPSSFHRI